MRNMIAPCGTNCSRCPSYKENLLTDEDRQRCSDGWSKYLGFRLSPEKLLTCDGCRTPDDENPVRYINCNKRKCALFNGVVTCAHCSAYPCQVFGTSDPGVTREQAEARVGEAISEEAYLTFVEPYESIRHLEELRASLDQGDIVEMTPVSFEPQVADFVSDLAVPERAAYESLHGLIGRVGAASGISYAWREVLKKRRRHLLKMLWAFGLLGELEEEGGPHLVLDSEAYLGQKIHSNYLVVKGYFEALGEYGARCEHVPVEKEGWLTPTKALRKGGWYMTMAFDEGAGGVSVLNALRTYTTKLDEAFGQNAFSAKLDEAFGKNAFRRFSRADMQALDDKKS
jgi:hypothetical protein